MSKPKIPPNLSNAKVSKHTGYTGYNILKYRISKTEREFEGVGGIVPALCSPI